MTENITETMRDPSDVAYDRAACRCGRARDDGAKGERALCVFWSVEDAHRAMLEAGHAPEEGWKAIERDHQQLRLVMDVLATTSGPRLIHLEPAPGTPDLSGIFEADVFIGMLEESERA